MGGQTDSQVDSQVHASRKSRNFHAYTVELGGQNLRGLAYEFELDQSQRKPSQVNASGWPNEKHVLPGALIGDEALIGYRALIGIFTVDMLRCALILI